MSTSQSNKVSKPKKKKRINWPCDHCDYSSDRKWNLDRHINAKHLTFPCQQCSERFSNGEDLDEHISDKHLPFHCQQCSERFPSMERLNIHNAGEHRKNVEEDENYTRQGINHQEPLPDIDRPAGEDINFEYDFNVEEYLHTSDIEESLREAAEQDIRDLVGQRESDFNVQTHPNMSGIETPPHRAAEGHTTPDHVGQAAEDDFNSFSNMPRFESPAPRAADDDVNYDSDRPTEEYFNYETYLNMDRFE